MPLFMKRELGLIVSECKAGSEKAYLELARAGHLAPISSNTTIAKYSISWLKRFIDNDTRYDQFLCPGPTFDFSVSDYQNTCPLS